MTWTVYGLRLKGSNETRYIGHTRFTPEQRLRTHLNTTCNKASFRPMLPWVRANKDHIEAFAIAKCETRREALTTESVVIALCLRLGQPLLNGAQVPPHLQLVA